MMKTFLPQVHCGLTNHTLTRRKRIIGGETARKVKKPITRYEFIQHQFKWALLSFC